ncbi:unnamed protein product [Albugo candida]|uniref:Uncharacterized protein n=1 Tax=Albugo candida TaxID=65357 RepID=A0A024FWS3_9STRA|nr:unnamed protein product [Albugo candida]|eukprot:CCI11628.1 unnamed protein product [Albugo candida]
MHQTREPLQKRFEVQITRRVRNRDTVYPVQHFFSSKVSQQLLEPDEISKDLKVTMKEPMFLYLVTF